MGFMRLIRLINPINYINYINLINPCKKPGDMKNIPNKTIHMTLVALPVETQPVTLRPVFRKPNLRQWQEELDFLGREVRFYRLLLKSGIAHASERHKGAVFALLLEFSNTEDNTLPALRKELAAFREKSVAGNLQPLAFYQKVEQQSVALRPLKAQVFALMPQLQKITIV
jgi:hypothetical protein